MKWSRGKGYKWCALTLQWIINACHLFSLMKIMCPMYVILLQIGRIFWSKQMNEERVCWRILGLFLLVKSDRLTKNMTILVGNLFLVRLWTFQYTSYTIGYSIKWATTNNETVDFYEKINLGVVWNNCVKPLSIFWILG